ncbi:hypothetical protein GQ42DRAFT_149150 [Ramicandelaber brevisporus]|nr:hypothetical protein GQ42DRAFT_149150 [Ramicandelaber brevisporus]
MLATTLVARRQQSRWILAAAWRCRSERTFRQCYSTETSEQQQQQQPQQQQKQVEIRRNAANIQMLTEGMHRMLFPPSPETPPPSEHQITCAREHLKQQGLWGRAAETIPPIDFSQNAPPLLGGPGSTLDEHFLALGNRVAEPYLSMALAFAQDPQLSKTPPMPPEFEWRMQAGWTRYPRLTDPAIGYRSNPHSLQPHSVPYPAEDALTFDVETQFNESPYPLMAAAVSSDAWYLWVSPYVCGISSSPEHLIPLGERSRDRPRIIVGHNVGFDRSHILEEYSLRDSNTAYIDTMSLHVAVSGLCNQQRARFQQYSKARTYADFDYLAAHHEDAEFVNTSALNSLRDVAKLYCNIELDKSARDTFETGTLQDVRDQFNELARYCATDVLTTLMVYQKLLPAFLKRCPHPVTFAGMMRMSKAFLPVDQEWNKYINRSERICNSTIDSISERLKQLVNQALDTPSDERISDPWLRNLDWFTPPLRMTKARYKKDGTYAKGGEPKPVARQRLPGYPNWYRDLYDTKISDVVITVRTRIAPYLLRLKWHGFPVYYSNEHGWAFRVPAGDPFIKSTQATPLKFKPNPKLENASDADADTDADTVYYGIPHKDGHGAKVGSPLAKGYVNAFDDGTLTSEFPLAKEALLGNALSAYWTSARARVMNQLVVWDESLKTPDEPDLTPDEQKLKAGLILPRVVPMGTVTRRGMERTWMTAANANKKRIGSELKSIVHAPKGYTMVGADVDSEELWIASLMGDAQFRIHGASAIGWMTLQGNKGDGTDVHSRTASILGIGRGAAKTFNYGRIYGAGVQHASHLLIQFNPLMDLNTANRKAVNLYAATKGTADRTKLSFNRSYWFGGSESHMFNSIEQLSINAEDARTPVLWCGITTALQSHNVGSRFVTSRVNWVVQSSGVDYLHLLLASMDYLIARYQIDARFMISVHDEVRYIVKDEDKYRAALALQISNLWTRAMFAYRMGFDDLPQSVAFFSAVDLDTVLRKEVDMDCITPSNPYPIPQGETADITNVLDKTNGGVIEPSSESKKMTLHDWYIPPEDEVAENHHSDGRRRPHDEMPVLTELNPSLTFEVDDLFLRAQSMKSRREIEAMIASSDNHK